MRNLRKLTFTLFMLAASFALAQVGINTNTPQTTLDVTSTNVDESIAPNPDNLVQTREGVLLPRVNDLFDPAAITDSLQGVDEGQLLYVNGSGFNYWDGTRWLRLAGTTSNQTDVDAALFADRLGSPNLFSSISGLDGEGVFTGTGRSNISIGQESFGGTADISQDANIAIGSSAGANSTIIQDNVMMIGTNAGESSTNNRSGTILIGNNAGSGSDLQGQTIAIGLNAARGTKTFNNSGGNIFIGGSAGEGSSGPNTTPTTRGENTIIGNRAALNAGFSIGSIIIGTDAANGAPEIRQENLIIGNAAASGGSSRMDDFNLIIGHNAAIGSTLVNGNTIIGNQAGTGINLGNNNVLLGSNTTSTAGSAANSTALGTGATITKANQTVIGGATNTEVVLNGRLVLPTASSSLAGEAGLYQAAETVTPTSAKGIYAFDSDGNATQISPHNFSIIPEGASEEMAWAFYSKNENLGKEVNVDMMKLTRMVEKISGEKLVHMKSLETGAVIENDNLAQGTLDVILEKLQKLEEENALLKARIETLENQ